MRLTDGLWRSSAPGASARLRPRVGEWNSARGSSRSLPSYDEHDELRLSTGERPMSGRLEDGGGGCCCCWWENPDGVTRSRGGEMGSDLMLRFWLVLMDKLEPWGKWQLPLNVEIIKTFINHYLLIIKHFMSCFVLWLCSLKDMQLLFKQDLTVLYLQLILHLRETEWTTGSTCKLHTTTWTTASGNQTKCHDEANDPSLLLVFSLNCSVAAKGAAVDHYVSVCSFSCSLVV